MWSLRDLHSSNGIFLGDVRVQNLVIGQTTALTLGIAGPVVTFELVKDTAGDDTVAGETQWLDRHLGKTQQSVPAGEQTMMIRRALKRVQRKQRYRYSVALGLFAVLIAASVSYALFLRAQVRNSTRLAQSLFYTMKAVDVDIAKAEQSLSLSDAPNAEDRLRSYQRKRERLEEDYNRFVTALNIYDSRLSPENRLIMRVARIFGESELAMPADFANEVARYIARWRSSGRFERAIRLAKKNGYDRAIGHEFLSADLPPQFFYLAMQESDFDQYVSGPPTRKGIAKGMWQFIPETGAKYGLRIGPLLDVQRPDPSDDRDRFDLATRAAARYIKDLYSTDAQGSGLLVMACYNWGDDRVLPLVRSMPENPRERNFWKFRGRFKDRTPQETYDYVFSIVAAAVIGENPHLFGFDFDNPLAELEKK